MELDFAFLCDYAGCADKLNAMGIGFDAIIAPSVPCSHKQMYVVLQFRGDIGDGTSKTLELRLVDEDGNDIMPVQSHRLEILPAKNGTPSVARIIVGIADIPFIKYGHYAFHVTVDGKEVKRLPIRVCESIG